MKMYENCAGQEKYLTHNFACFHVTMVGCIGNETPIMFDRSLTTDLFNIFYSLYILSFNTCVL